MQQVTMDPPEKAEGAQLQANSSHTGRISHVVQIAKGAEDLQGSAKGANHNPIEDVSTASTISRAASESSPTTAEHETEPTSIPSDEVPADSFKADHGSGSDRPSPTQSSSSNGLDEELPNPTTAEKVGQTGAHFPNISIQGTDQDFHNPENDDEARAIKDKVVRASAIMDAAYIDPQRQFLDGGSPYHISVQPPQIRTSMGGLESNRDYNDTGGRTIGQLLGAQTDQSPRAQSDLLPAQVRQPIPRRARRKVRRWLSCSCIML